MNWFKFEAGITTPWFWLGFDSPDWTVDPPYRPRLIPRLRWLAVDCAEFRRYVAVVWLGTVTVGWGRQLADKVPSKYATPAHLFSRDDS